MIATKKEAAAPTATKEKSEQKQSYSVSGVLSSPERLRRIAKRQADIPRIYRRIYQQAVRGQSRKAAIHAFCLECCGWEKEEIRRCTALSCPLYALRPYQQSRTKAKVGANRIENRPGFAPESKNSAQEHIG